MERLNLRRATPLGVFISLIILAAAVTLALIARVTTPPIPDGQHEVPGDIRLSGRPVQALARLEAQAAVSGWTPALLKAAGDLWREAGDLTRAVPYWDAALAHDPAPALLRDLASAHLELAQWDDARAVLNAYLADELLEADRRWAAFQRGLLLISVDPAQAEADLRTARAEPAYAPVIDSLFAALDASPFSRLRLALVFGEARLWSHAERVLLQAGAGEGLDIVGYARLRAYLAYVRAQMGRDASELLRYALELAPADAQVRTFEGLYWRARGALAASRDALLAAVALEPDNPTLYAELAAALELLGDTQQARHWLERAVAFSDGDPRFQALLDALPPP
jgi:tetratricopeptide (TPR) repeat protein